MQLPKLSNKAIVSSRAEAEIFGKTIVKDNITATSKHCVVSEKPLIYLISLERHKYSNSLIQKSGCFCVNLMRESFQSKIDICDEKRGEHLDKFKVCNFLKQECLKIECCSLKESDLRYECEVIKSEEVGDSILYLGKVVSKQP